MRNTRDVDILLRRDDLAAAERALAPAGFVHRHAAGIDMFLDGPEAKARDAVRVRFAGENVRPDDLHAAPLVTDSEPADQLRVATLEALLRMKLTSHRRKDQVHVLDMIDVGLVGEEWCERLPEDLAAPLRDLLEHPDD